MTTTLHRVIEMVEARARDEEFGSADQESRGRDYAAVQHRHCGRVLRSLVEQLRAMEETGDVESILAKLAPGPWSLDCDNDPGTTPRAHDWTGKVCTGLAANNRHSFAAHDGDEHVMEQMQLVCDLVNALRKGPR